MFSAFQPDAFQSNAVQAAGGATTVACDPPPDGNHILHTTGGCAIGADGSGTYLDWGPSATPPVPPDEQAPSGGWVHGGYGRRRTRNELDAERRRLGIIPPEAEEVVQRAVKRNAKRLVRQAEQTAADPYELLQSHLAAYESQLAQMLQRKELEYRDAYLKLMLAGIEQVVAEREQEAEDINVLHLLMEWM